MFLMKPKVSLKLHQVNSNVPHVRSAITPNYKTAKFWLSKEKGVVFMEFNTRENK